MAGIEKKPKGYWWREEDLTTLADLHATLSYPLSDLHMPEFAQEEEEIFQHYLGWIKFVNHVFKLRPQEGKRFYDIHQTLYYDLMGLIPRGGFDQHFDVIGPYYAQAHMEYREMEIIATSKDFGYCNMEQHYFGITTDDKKFDFTHRITGLLRKRDGVWKWVFEHVSFPVNIATKLADFTCNQHAGENLLMGDKDDDRK